MIEAIKHFLDVFKNAPAAETERLRMLAAALDGLSVGYNNTSDAVFDERDYPEPPKTEHLELRSIAEARFPDFGQYPDVLPAKASEADVDMHDAIDDLTDIAQELSETLWRWENTSRVDAMWYFRWSFENHWGRHLLNLRRYIYFKQFGH